MKEKMTEITDEDIEHLKHKDFKNKKHKEGCTCGYCELKRWEKQQQLLRAEFNKRIKSLSLDPSAREGLFTKFEDCWNTDFRCFYCKRRMELHFENEFSFTIDHTVPKANHGQDTVENLEFACRICNFLKGDMDAEKYINNMERLKSRKKKKEYRKARKATEKDKQMRDAYKDIFERRGGI